MVLSDEQIGKVMDALYKYWPSPKRCPVCTHTDWTIGNKVYELREFGEGPVVMGAALFPVITVMCTFCSYTMLFNAIRLGILGSKGKEAKDE